DHQIIKSPDSRSEHMDIDIAVVPVAGLGTRLLPATNIAAERNAAGRPQAGRAVRRRRAGAGRHEAGAVRDRSGQGVDRKPFRSERRADSEPAGKWKGRPARGAGIRAREHAVLLYAAAAAARARP